jgi:hypothetical protein
MKMKLLLTATAFFYFSFLTKAQTYTLAFANQPYQELQDDSIISSDTNWVGKDYPVFLPFPVRVGSQVVSQIFINTDGRIRRRTTSGGFTSFRTMIWAFGNCGLRRKANDTSKISFKLEGISPNRIAKIQFKNAGFVGDETHTDKVNFQIWLHEDGKRIEIAFGPVQTIPMRSMNGAYGPFIGLGSQYVRGNPNAPLLGSLDYGLSGIPQNGFVYRFLRP